MRNGIAENARYFENFEGEPLVGNEGLKFQSFQVDEKSEFRVIGTGGATLTLVVQAQ